MKINVAVRYPQMNADHAFWKKSKTDKTGRIVTTFDATPFNVKADDIEVKFDNPEQVAVLADIIHFLAGVLERYRLDTKKLEGAASMYVRAADAVSVAQDHLAMHAYVAKGKDELCDMIKTLNDILKVKVIKNVFTVSITVKK